MAPANILIVEDEIIIAEDLQTRLKRLGYSVAAVAFSGVKAVDQTIATAPDLVLMDIMLKGDTDGIEVARQIRAKLDVPIIYVTAYADNAKLQRAIHTEPYGYIIKPFRERELFVAIEMALYKHKKERELKERLEKLQLMANSLPAMISYIDAEQRCRFTNKAFEEWSGRSCDELNGQQIKDIIGEAAYLEIQPYVEDALKGKRTTYESLMPGKDGEMRCISTAYIPSLNTQGEVAGFFAVVNDITGQKQAADELQRLRAESATDIQGRTADLIKTGQQMEAEISRQKQADEELQKLLDESALHVQELTAEIERANQKLEAETAGRKQAEDELQKLRSESAAEGQGCIADLLKTNQQLETKLAEHRRAEDKLHILFEEIKHEADRSKSLLQIVEALNLRPDTGEIVKNVLDLAPKYLNLDRGCIFIYDEDNKDFSFTGGYGLNHSEENALSARTFTLNDFPAADKILQGSPVSVENTRETGAMDKEIVKIFNIVNAVIAPIAFEGKVTGLFYGDFRSGSPIEPREVTFLKKLADWLGVAIQNSRLYKES
ncbi:response regulator, partial [Candidatus Woesearchaeota archaeon]|nr:response regulator [Candidatus Woesearchaeota archaeon]